MLEALDIQVKGVVQGVGFRPFVYRLAKRNLLNGWVMNAVDGVHIHVEGDSANVDAFVRALSDDAPAAAKVSEITLEEVPLGGFDSFQIQFSELGHVNRPTLVSPDLATCDDCVRELFDPKNRRYRYPFINCTNCGPRFTIIDKLPYDRAHTSMAAFEMCEECAGEYADPGNRRFHAQPDACFECGPHISWSLAGEDEEIVWGEDRETSDELFARAVDLIAQGGIVAVKGLGGFHLVCDARNPEALAKLRNRKHRDGKAFAVMMPSVHAARGVCAVSDEEAALMESPARPIVLLKKRDDVEFAAGLADSLPELGVMLPATPVQHLLIHDFMETTGGDMLVMTSGNVHDEPIETDDAHARKALGGIADAFLGNDRPILSRYDDSVARVLDLGTDEKGEPLTGVQFIRRARGYAPLPLADKYAAPDDSDENSNIAADAPTVFAAGPEQKATFSFERGGEVYVSQHIGDMENADVYDAWLAAKHRFERLFDLHATQLACDAHPEYLASKWAHEQASTSGMELVEVQHHHAHVASVLGEHGLYGPACGIAFDGTGFGADGAIWGGEVLLANRADYERFANFTYIPMPGGAAAVKHPLRMAYGALWAFDLLDHPVAQRVLAALGPQADVCAQMIERGLNTPSTSSVGRLFDAASALLGICTEPTYEGEAAILLDAARAKYDPVIGTAAQDVRDRYAIEVTKNSAVAGSTAHDTSVVLFDAAPTFKALLDDVEAGVDRGIIALRFHEAFVGAVVTAAELVRAVYGISLVVLSGGVFMNRYLVETAVQRLHAAGFTVALNADLPPNDGCIAYGQAIVATPVAAPAADDAEPSE